MWDLALRCFAPAPSYRIQGRQQVEKCCHNLCGTLALFQWQETIYRGRSGAAAMEKCCLLGKDVSPHQLCNTLQREVAGIELLECYQWPWLLSRCQGLGSVASPVHPPFSSVIVFHTIPRQLGTWWPPGGLRKGQWTLAYQLHALASE